MKLNNGLLLCAMIGVPLLAGCSQSDKKSETAANRLVYDEQNVNERFDNTDLKRQVFDMNHDGKVDLWKFYTYKKASDEEGDGELIIVRKELDINFDGRIDRIMYYNQKENLIKEEIDTNFDGIIDRIMSYDNGLLVRSDFYQLNCNRVEIDQVNAPEVNPNMSRYYRQGVMTREEIDAGCDGKREIVTLFTAEGEIAQIGQDNNGDGVIENWIRY